MLNPQGARLLTVPRSKCQAVCLGRRPALDRVEHLGVFIQELVLGLVGEILPFLDLIQILRELAVPMRNVGCV